MGEKRAYKVRKPGGDRKKLKQEQEGLKVGDTAYGGKCIVYDGNQNELLECQKKPSLCVIHSWGRWSDSLHGISFFKKRCMVKQKVIQS